MRSALCVALVLSLAAAAAAEVTREQLIEKARAGATDEDLIALVDKEGAPALSPEDIVALKEAGISDAVLQHILKKGAKANLVILNASMPGLKVNVDEENKILSIGSGKDVPKGGHLALKVEEGEYTVAGSIKKVKIPGKVTFNQAKAGDSMVNTAIIEDPERSTVILDVKEIPKPQPAAPPPGAMVPGRPMPGMSPNPFVMDMDARRHGVIPGVSNTVLLGAGIGAVIGHQRGKKYQGALVGAAAGALLDYLNERDW